MPISRDLRQLLAILDDEGFGVLAGEILAEISAGRIIDRDSKLGLGHAAADAEERDVLPATAPDDEPVWRVPIPQGEQLRVAIGLLRIRLVEPARRLAEAERISGELMNRAPVRFEFVDAEDRRLIDPIRDAGVEEPRAEAGDDRAAKALDALLLHIAGDTAENQI